jgi:hypothetical protein
VRRRATPHRGGRSLARLPPAAPLRRRSGWGRPPRGWYRWCGSLGRPAAGRATRPGPSSRCAQGWGTASPGRRGAARSPQTSGLRRTPYARRMAGSSRLRIGHTEAFLDIA